MSGPPNGPQRPSKPKFSPFGARTKAMGSSGWETYTVGFTLVGCIVAGAGAGWWLDNRFGTSFWLPILFFVGVIGGFREMFLVISRSTAQQKKEQDAKKAAETTYTPQTEPEIPPAPPRERIFQVPAPPIDGEKLPQIQAQVPETTEELIARLLESDEKPDEETDEKSK